MGRRATGTVVDHEGKDGRTYRALRFSAYGQRRYVALGAVDRATAERELRGVLADVERGVWRPDAPAPAPEPIAPEPTFHEFAEAWWIEHEHEWRAKTREDYRWRLERHLLPWFGRHTLRQITVAEVDRYRAAKLRDAGERRTAIANGEPLRDDDGRVLRPLSARSINMTLVLLGALLDVAEERELVERNVAKGKRRRVREDKPRRSYLDTAEQISALLDAAGALDAEATRYAHVQRRALLSVLTFAGLRIGEALALRWRDVDLASGRLTIAAAKTDAGRRHVTIRPVLRDALIEAKTSASDTRPTALVFGTSTGKRQGASNVRNRVLTPAIERANAAIEADDLAPLPDGLTPQSLRRTFASVLYALGESPATVMAEMGHTSPALALAVYAQAMRRDPGATERLRALVDGAFLADTGRRAAGTAPAPGAERAA